MPKKVDFLVVGSGIAGLTFATKIAEFGETLIITKKSKIDSNTNYAQGGIASVFGDDDSLLSHIEDTIKGGEGLCRKDAVELMVKTGPDLVTELYQKGCRFSIVNGGIFDLGREGGHSHRRIVHAKDFTGQEIERVLLEEAKRSGVTINENKIALDLCVRDNECSGLIYFDADRQCVDLMQASVTVLATGGAGQVYQHTTNPPIATGDGIAMAFRAGADIANMEFFQFHPTSVFNIKIDGRSYLISEAVRGEGAILKNREGHAFMTDYHEQGNLAPRDIVARACVKEMVKTGSKYVLLDISHREADYIKNRFPTIYETCLRWGMDITREPIPVVPAAHYLCGGIIVNTWSESSIKRLFALGECSCTGVHGANRLASNSLLEALVFASRAATKARDYHQINHIRSSEIDLNAKVGMNYRLIIKELMSQYVGVIRNTDDLEKAYDQIVEMVRSFDKGIHIINAESQNLVNIALMTIYSAKNRKESRGLHYLTDFPDKDERFQTDTVINIKNILE